jgi:valyl-tRNA synthetase
LQWFIDVNKKFLAKGGQASIWNIKGIKEGQEVSLKDLMLTVIKSEQIKILPKHFEKTYFHWIENLRDWCISRQIWYGHRVPVWYKRQSGEVVNPGHEQKLVSPDFEPDASWEQDPDTLDTWFSSGLWTFSTLVEKLEDVELKDGKISIKSDDFKNYHPTSILETGYDILFFWVARMILMTTYLLGDIPFETVYLHGLVRDEKNRKMSKSLGNIIDPLDTITKFGADATRMSLIMGTSPGNDIKISEDKIKGYKHFANKLWNITRFVLSSVENIDFSNEPNLAEIDKKHLEELSNIIKETTNEMEAYKFYLAGDKLYHYIWHNFADKILEESKEILNSEDEKGKISRQWMIFKILKTSLILLHPFMPFITEEIWSLLPNTNNKLLMVEKWPK